MVVLVILASAFLINYLIEKLYSRYWSKDLEAEVAFPREFAYEGEKASLTETITNKKWMFLPVLSVGFQVHRNLIFAEDENASVSDLSYKRDIFSVGGYQKITRKVPFLCSKRGYYELEKIELVIRGPLLTGKCFKTLECRDFFYVLPGGVRQELLEIPFQKIMDSVTTKRNLYEDPFEFRGIREYQPTDPWNKINWKASARSDQLMVNLFDSKCAQEIRILLDLEEETIWKFDDIHEEAIRLSAALAEECVANGIPVGIMTNGRDVKSGEKFSLKAGNETQQIQEIKRLLARIDLKKTAEPMLDLLQAERENMENTSCTYVMIAKNQQLEKYQKLEELACQGVNVVWISTLYEDMEWTLPRNGKITTLFWEVPK